MVRPVGLIGPVCVGKSTVPPLIAAGLDRAVRLNGRDWVMEGVDILEEWVAGDQNRLLASTTLYTADQTPEQVAAAVLDALVGRSSAP